MLARACFRRTGIMRMFAGPEQWMIRLKAQEESRRAAADKANTSAGKPSTLKLPGDQKPVRHHEMAALRGEWDPHLGAKITFRDESGTDVRVDRPSCLFRTKLLVGQSIAVTALPWITLATVANTGVGAPEIFGCVVVSSILAAASTAFHRRLVAIVVSMRIIPADDATPQGAVLELGVPVSCVSSQTRFIQVPLGSISGLAASADGVWRTLGVRSRGKLELYHLSSLACSNQIIPYVVSMKRHLESLEPEQRKLVLCLASKPPFGDPARVVWLPNTDFLIPDVTVDDPYPNFDAFI
ncbi:hypothetical protein DIPPA_54328 [Diplonema papillatum]|nr:hypothetical protein DIPPA_54328 [Diplonema papillatum]